jgi:tetratricopeptide (TPR) repeat protein
MDDAELKDACTDSCIRGAVFQASLRPESLANSLVLLEQVHQLRPTDPLPLLWMSRLLLYADRVDDALPHLITARSLCKSDSGTGSLLAELLADAGLATEDNDLIQAAVSEYRRLIKSGTHRLEHSLSLGRLLVQTGNFELALPVLLEASNDPTRAFEALYLHGVALLELSRPSEALPYFQKLLRYAPEDPNILQSIAWCLLKLGNTQACQLLLDTCEQKGIELPSRNEILAELGSNEQL